MCVGTIERLTCACIDVLAWGLHMGQAYACMMRKTPDHLRCMAIAPGMQGGTPCMCMCVISGALHAMQKIASHYCCAGPINTLASTCRFVHASLCYDGYQDSHPSLLVALPPADERGLQADTTHSRVAAQALAHPSSSRTHGHTASHNRLFHWPCSR